MAKVMVNDGLSNSDLMESRMMQVTRELLANGEE